MKNRRSYYRILHVQPDAPEQVIRSSYRTMMQRLRMHPDLGGDHENAALINEAYAVLMDAEARAEYDSTIRHPPRSGDCDSNDSAVKSKKGKSRSAESPAQDDGCDSAAAAESAEGAICSCFFCGAWHGANERLQPQSECSRCGSPLCSVATQRHAMSDQRAIERLTRQFAVSLALGWPRLRSAPARTQDISLNGMLLVTDVLLARDQVVSISSELLHAVARVVDCRAGAPGCGGAYRVGVSFLTLRIRRSQGGFVSVEA